jgi:DNA-binding LacI/PurR family transcriptional regulator
MKTIADIAKITGVSKSTVSRALNNSTKISLKVREKIQEIAKSNNFVAHQGARNLTLKKTYTIGLVIPLVSCTGQIITDTFFIELLKGITTGVTKYNYDLLIIQSYEKKANDIYNYIKSRRVDGLILIGGIKFLKSIFQLLPDKAPVAYWGNFNKNYSCVDCDNYTGGFIATNYLIKTGKNKIVFLGGPKNEPEVIQRYKGYSHALKKAGLNLNPEYVTYGDYSNVSGYDKMKGIINLHPDINGVFACNDIIAIGAMRFLNEKKYKIPEDISIIGFDDIPSASQSLPPLTTVKQSIIESGNFLVDNLINYIESGKVNNTVMPVNLVVRKSTY